MGLLSRRGRSVGVSCLTVAALALSVSSNIGVGNASTRTNHATWAGQPNVLVEAIAAKSLWAGTLDPSLITALDDADIVQKIYAGLVKQVYSDTTHKFTIVPDLAAGMPTISKDGLVYTFKIRPDAKFSDGTAVTAQDFVHSFERVLDPKANSGANYYLFDIAGAEAMSNGKAKHLSGVKALDAQTLRITLKHPVVYFLYALSYETGMVVKSSVPVGANLTTDPKLVIGAGPWMLKDGAWKYRSQITLVPNPNYFGAKNFKLKEIDIVFTGSDQTMFNAYKAGQFPMTWLPSAEVARSKALPEYHEVGVLGDLWYSMNSNYKPFNDVHFRRAIAYGIDRNAIAAVDHGTVQPLYCWYPNGIMGYDASCKSKYPHYDPTIAKKELALALKDMGGTMPSGVQLEYATEISDRAREAAAVQANLKAIGINIGLHGVPRATWIKDGNSGKTPFMVGDWFDDYPDPQDFSDYLIRTGAGENWGRYSNPTVDALFDKGNVERDAASRERIYKQAQGIILNDAAVAMLYQFAQQDLFTTKWHGMEMNPSWGNNPQPMGNDWANVTVSS